MKLQSGKPSIYVKALNRLVAHKRLIGSSDSAAFQLVPFDLKDCTTGKLIRYSTMLEAHIACSNDYSKFPRILTPKDRKVRFGSTFFDMFRKRYDSVFGSNLLIEENVSKENGTYQKG